MTTTNPPDAQMKLADVTDADRKAAADFFECSTFAGRDAFLRGDEDSSDVVQAFARHRLATEARAQGLVEALGEELFVLSDKLRATDWLQDDMNHHLYERVVSAFQALATWRRT